MKKIKQQKYVTEEQLEIKKFIIVLLGLVLIIVGIYFFTRAFVTKDLGKKESDITYQTGAIDYSTAIVGTMLNRPVSEYYVFAFKKTNEKAAEYQQYITDYRNQAKSLHIYTVDLDNELNKKYVAGENDSVSKSFESLDKLKLGNITVIKVKDGKVEKFLTKTKDIKKELKLDK